MGQGRTLSKISDRQRLRIAEALAREAGHLGLRYYRRRESLVIESKGLQDIVSEADREVEAMLRQQVRDLFPGDGFLGEEHDEEIAADGHGTWVVDPIDGTWCFLNGIASWCVSIAFVDDGRIIAGIIYDPNTEELFSATEGGGAFLNGRPIRVADAKALSAGTVSVGFSTRRKAEDVEPLIGNLLRQDGMYHRHGSGALGLAWTAAGRLIGYLEPHMNSWDCLAGLLLVKEAGGVINDFLRNDGLHKGNPVLACPPGIKEQLDALTAHW